APAGVVDPVRLHNVPGRDLADAAQLGRGVVPERRLLQRGRQGWPLRRMGGARAVLRRDPSGVQTASRAGSNKLTSAVPLPQQAPEGLAEVIVDLDGER